VATEVPAKHPPRFSQVSAFPVERRQTPP